MLDSRVSLLGSVMQLQGKVNFIMSQVTAGDTYEYNSQEPKLVIEGEYYLLACETWYVATFWGLSLKNNFSVLVQINDEDKSTK